ncbi:hypothetical protein NE237_010545 [Protea cynaroides]|uniref:Uncharacterized protein n=1 Tax=Protea cynaroides TaxID=273540 RepID=A0A9Q0R1B7_9MAGN|nr:hypothetical protein NE237_010545 [Protea cynaroides]
MRPADQLCVAGAPPFIPQLSLTQVDSVFKSARVVLALVAGSRLPAHLKFVDALTDQELLRKAYVHESQVWASITDGLCRRYESALDCIATLVANEKASRDIQSVQFGEMQKLSSELSTLLGESVETEAARAREGLERIQKLQAEIRAQTVEEYKQLGEYKEVVKEVASIYFKKGADYLRQYFDHKGIQAVYFDIPIYTNEAGDLNGMTPKNESELVRGILSPEEDSPLRSFLRL